MLESFDKWMRIWRNFESNVSLWVKGCEVTFHRDQVLYCYVWKWTLKKLPLFGLIYMFVYKMRLFMNDVLFIMLIQFIDNDWFNRCNANEYCIQGYFCPMSFSPCYNCKRFNLVLNSPHAVMLTKIFVCNIEFDHAVLNSSSDNEDERGENNTGANISLYTVYHL